MDSGQSSYQKQEAEILDEAVSKCRKFTTARVRLSYRAQGVPMCIPSTMMCKVEIKHVEGERKRKVNRKLFDAGWDWLDGYFGGDPFEDDCLNIFDQVESAEETVPIQLLSREKEALLQKELREIESEFAPAV